MKTYSFTIKLNSDSKRTALVRLLRKIISMLEQPDIIDGSPVRLEFSLCTTQRNSNISAVLTTRTETDERS